MTTFGLGLPHYPSQHRNQPSFGAKKGKIDDPRILAARKAWKETLDAEKAEEEEKASREAKEREIQEAQAAAELRAKEQPPHDTLSLSRSQTHSSAVAHPRRQSVSAESAEQEQEKWANLAAALEKKQAEQKKKQNDKHVMALAKKALAYIFKTCDCPTNKVELNHLYSKTQPDGSIKQGTLYDLGAHNIHGAENDEQRRRHLIARIESMEDLQAKLEEHVNDELTEPTAKKLFDARHYMYHAISEEPFKIDADRPTESRAARQRRQQYEHPGGTH